MEILAAYDLTGSLRAAAELTGCSHHTVARHVAAGTLAGRSPNPPRGGGSRTRYLPKIEEWIEASKGRIRADKAHEKLLALGYEGSERSTRRAIAQVKAAWRLGHTRVHRPRITEPGMWLQYDFGDGALNAFAITFAGRIERNQSLMKTGRTHTPFTGQSPVRRRGKEFDLPKGITHMALIFVTGASTGLGFGHCRVPRPAGPRGGRTRPQLRPVRRYRCAGMRGAVSGDLLQIDQTLNIARQANWSGSLTG
jgi:hypothetical protein